MYLFIEHINYLLLVYNKQYWNRGEELKGKPKYIIYKFNLFLGYYMSYVRSWRSYCESRTGIKVRILKFDLFLSVMLDSLSCSFTSTFFLANMFIVTFNNMVVNSFFWQKKLEYPWTYLKLLKKFITKSGFFWYTDQHGLGINSHQSCV